MKLRFIFTIAFLACLSIANKATTPVYQVFEYEIINKTNYSNKFTDVTLKVQYQSPSGKVFNFWGFYDGDGKGNINGDVWKIRFMPDETGEWNYIYTWSDGTKGGNGKFDCVEEGAGKGILQPYGKNPHWLAYNGTEPVWLKSYYETGHGSIGQDLNWVAENVYTPLIKAGYNHLQVNWLLSLCCFEQYYKDGPKPETSDLLLYKEGELFTSFNLDAWRRMEQHLGWLNKHSVGVHMFLGVDGSKNDGPDWSKLSYEEKDWFVKYLVARLAPFANIAGWNYVWEVPGDREGHELGFARLIRKYDIFNHLCTYEDEMPRYNEYTRPEYTFAAVENHEITSSDKEMERHLWKEPWTHHMACLLAYKGKPVFMSEGNALWRRYWQQRSKATQDDLRRSAWACATAGSSFTWNGHASEYDLFASGPEGLPFDEANPYIKSEKCMRILADVMNNKVEFFKMNPFDKLLEDHPALDVYALAEPGEQYLVFSTKGAGFSINIVKGEYSKVYWIDAINGNQEPAKSVSVTKEKEKVIFEPPSVSSDWILMIRK